MLYSPAPLINIIKKPPVIAKFFKKDINCIWLEKSVWKIIASDMVNKASIIAASFVLYPMITSSGNKISIIIAGIN